MINSATYGSETISYHGIDMLKSTAFVLGQVVSERQHQDSQWGEQNHAPLAWLAILAEEFGEFAEMVTKGCVPPTVGPREQRVYLRAARQELLQVAAVAIATIESLDRNELA